MAGFMKGSDLTHSAHAYNPAHHHHTHGHLSHGIPGMPMSPFNIPHGLDAVGFPQGVWGKYCFIT